MDQNWIKIKLPKIRPVSQSSASIYSSKLYIYGGQSSELTNQFVQVDLTTYSYELLSHPINPGPLAKHKSTILQNKLYLFGGSTLNGLSNKIHTYDFNEKLWIQLEINDTYPKPYDGHALTIIDQETIAIFGGFYEDKLSNTLYFYNVKTNKFSIQSESNGPSPRESASLNYVNNKFYVFGGCNYIRKFDDLWIFYKAQWNQIEFKIHPKARSGHTMVTYNNMLILFGGIYSVTWEMDDLWIFNNEWHQIYGDSSRKLSRSQEYILKQKYRISQQSQSPQQQQTRHSTMITMVSALEEKKLKKQVSEKQRMLSSVELKNERDLIIDTPSTAKMRNALIVLGVPINQVNHEQYKSQFEQITQQETKVLINQRPFPRDGHCAEIYQNKLIIFGGDRHKMQFNDIFLLELTNIIQQ